MGSQIQWQAPLLSALLFKTFPYFQYFRILANAANFCKTFLINFMSDKSDNWAGEYLLGPMFHQQRYRPSGFKIQNYQCKINMENIGMPYVHFKE